VGEKCEILNFPKKGQNTDGDNGDSNTGAKKRKKGILNMVGPKGGKTV